MTGERNRGQLILVAGLGIAVTFVVLALLLNTVIYTENLATRSSDVGADQVSSYQHAVREGLGGALVRANDYNYSSYDSLGSRFRTDVRLWDGNATQLRVVDGEVSTVRLVETTNGTRISQDAAGNFQNASGDTDWTVARGLTGTRRFELNVTKGGLADHSGVFGTPAGLLGSSAFRIRVDNASATWHAGVYHDTATDEVVVQVVNASGDLAGSCAVDRDHVVVDLAAGTVAGTPCAPLAFPGANGAYEIDARNGNAFVGNYTLVVDRRLGPLRSTYATDPYYDQGNGVPYATDAIYNATLNVSVTSPAVTYATNVTVAPTGGPRIGVSG